MAGFVTPAGEGHCTTCMQDTPRRSREEERWGHQETRKEQRCVCVQRGLTKGRKEGETDEPCVGEKGLIRPGGNGKNHSSGMSEM